jgi:magnesium-transporting ATPase (P-type)
MGSTDLSELAKVCALCNQAVIHYQDGKYERVGEPTEAALKVQARTLALSPPPSPSHTLTLTFSPAPSHPHPLIH